MAYIHIRLENPGHKIAVMNALREAYRHIPHRFEPETKSSLILVADTSQRQDEDLLGKVRALKNDCSITITPIHELYQGTSSAAKGLSEEYTQRVRGLEQEIAEAQSQIQTLQSRCTQLDELYTRSVQDAEAKQVYAAHREEGLTQEKDRAQRRIQEAVEARRAAETAQHAAEKNYQASCQQYTELTDALESSRREGATSASRIASLEQSISTLTREIESLRKRHETPRPIEDLVFQWIESYTKLYEHLAACVAAIDESFDPSLTVEQLLVRELEKQGIKPLSTNGHQPEVPWEETPYHRTHGKDYLDKKRQLNDLEQHEAAVRAGNPDQSPILQLNIADSIKEKVIRSLKDEKDSNLQFIRAYEEARSAYASSLQEIKETQTLISTLRREITERRSQEEKTIEHLAESVPDDAKVIPIFLLQKEQDTAYTLTVVLPVGTRGKESLSDAIRYFHFMLEGIAVKSEPRHHAWMPLEHETLIRYEAACPKDRWNRSKMQVLREQLTDAMRAESVRYPLFKAGYRIKPVSIEIDDRTDIGVPEAGEDQKIGPYLRTHVFRLIQAGPQGLSSTELRERLEHDPEVMERLRHLGCAEIKPWHIRDALRSLLAKNIVEKVSPEAPDGERKKGGIYKVRETP